jgi:anti-anti-sigma factor
MFRGRVLSYPSCLMEPTRLDLERQAGSNGSRIVIRLNGKLSLETVHNFIQSLRPEPSPQLILDLSGVSFLDSAGVGALVQLFVHRRNLGQTFALAGLTKQSSAVIQVAGLTKLLPIHASVAEALAQPA